MTAFAMSGYMSITGDANREPVKPAGNFSQHQGGLHAATGIMAALLQRELTGSGQLVDASITEATCFAASMLGPFLNTGNLYRRDGSRHPTQNSHHGYPTTILPCKGADGRLHYPSSGNDMIALLLEEPRLLDPEIAAEPRGHADEFDALCLPWLSEHDKFDVVRRAQELRLPFTEVLEPEECSTIRSTLRGASLQRLRHGCRPFKAGGGAVSGQRNILGDRPRSALGRAQQGRLWR